MSPKALVIGNDLAALVTALRLQEEGFAVRVMEAPVSMERNPKLPVVLHGPLEHTDSLLRRIGAPSFINSLEPVSLEFLTASQDTRTFRFPSLPAPWHTLIGFFFFSGLSGSSRWKFLNNLEKIWEGEIHLSPGLHLQTAQDWLISCGQDAAARQRIWNPLCLFLLGDHLARTAAWPFIQTLKAHFLQSRTHSKIKVSSVGYDDLFLSPLRNQLEQRGVSFLQGAGIRELRMSDNQLEGVSTDDGQTHTSDIYIATISPFQLTECMPERILARFGFFHQLNQLTAVPAVILNFSFSRFLPKSRLVLTGGMFHCLTCRPSRQDDSGTRSYISCVATANEQLNGLSDEHLQAVALQEIQTIFPDVDRAITPHSLSCDLVRQPRASITYSPGTMTFRPGHQTPLTNLFLAGHWTNTDAVIRIEGDIRSANLCAELIKEQTFSGQCRR